ncbi:hypothetical protein KEM55_009230, partial [Ascosphaera atra]
MSTRARRNVRFPHRPDSNSNPNSNPDSARASSTDADGDQDMDVEMSDELSSEPPSPTLRHRTSASAVRERAPEAIPEE